MPDAGGCNCKQCSTCDAGVCVPIPNFTGSCNAVLPFGQCFSGACARIWDGGSGQSLGYSVSLGSEPVRDAGPGILIGARATASSAGAAYLYSISSITPLRTWSGTPGEQLGTSVSLGPDADTDGFGDLAIGAPTYSTGGTNRGRVFFFSGDDGGALATSPWLGATGDQRGAVVSVGPDTDGDGRADVAVAVPGLARVYLFSGGTGQVLQTFDGGSTGDGFGNSLSLGPDVNGDGFGDLLIGAPAAPNGSRLGRVYLYSGKTGALLWTKAGTTSAEQFGYSVSLGPDADGDTKSDMLIGAPGSSGRVDLYSGSSKLVVHTLSPTSPAGFFGNAVSLGPDADGDGKADALVGAPGTNSDQGRVYLFSGQSGALLGFRDGEPGLATQLGSSVSLGPDVDGDGKADALVGASFGDGKAYLFGSRGWPSQ